MLKPLANAYVNAAGYRRVGLKYDDLIPEERIDVAKVGLLPLLSSPILDTLLVLKRQKWDESMLILWNFRL